MQQLNNMDIAILVIVGISALIALGRGLVKEVLSIVGWVLAGAAVIYLLPILNPFTLKYIESGWMAGIATAAFILIVFMIVWIYATAGVVGKIRTSKLSGLDRLLGLFFGIVRAFLLIVLMYILISWMMPVKSQPDLLKKSKYFQIAGNFAEPIEKLIPKDTLDAIKEKTSEVGLTGDDDDEPAAEQKPAEAEKDKDKSDVDALFEKLAQPQIEKMREDRKKLQKIKEDFDGYNAYERDNLNRLIENTVE
jgi:membrane protein required for colicin V production